MNDVTLEAPQSPSLMSANSSALNFAGDAQKLAGDAQKLAGDAQKDKNENKSDDDVNSISFLRNQNVTYQVHI